MTHYVRDLPDALTAIQHIIDDIVSEKDEEISDLENEIVELEARVAELEAEVGDLKEYKYMYEELSE